MSEMLLGITALLILFIGYLIGHGVGSGPVVRLKEETERLEKELKRQRSRAAVVIIRELEWNWEATFKKNGKQYLIEAGTFEKITAEIIDALRFSPDDLYTFYVHRVR